MNLMFLAVAFLVVQTGWGGLGLSDPARLKAGGAYIDVEHGHAHPTLADLDGDGKPELLVGQFEGGKLRVYKNAGTATKPDYTTFAWFQAGGTTASVPYG